MADIESITSFAFLYANLFIELRIQIDSYFSYFFVALSISASTVFLVMRCVDELLVFKVK